MYYIGIDVQSRKDCPYAVMGESGRVEETGWLPSRRLNQACKRLGSNFSAACIGIDAPRQALHSPREFYCRSGTWTRRDTQVGSGRHCEVVIAALRLANPQWTPLMDDAPNWMRNGFEMYKTFDNCEGIRTFEVFPTASYRQLENDLTAEVTIPLKGFSSGPKDMLDAIVSAFTVKEFISGRGAAVGGGDGLGEIILPRPVPDPKHPALYWPTD